MFEGLMIAPVNNVPTMSEKEREKKASKRERKKRKEKSFD